MDESETREQEAHDRKMARRSAEANHMTSVLNERLEIRKENERLRESLRHALAQWRTNAEMGEDRDLRSEQTAEAALWREMNIEAGGY